ncbi:MAG TPA: hypothetical protein VG873_00270 [Burkholderiales bacterium]|nr:hypothetical protein [Burkholderiales bacterium]
MNKKPERKWLAILVLATGMAWAAGAAPHGSVVPKTVLLGN